MLAQDNRRTPLSLFALAVDTVRPDLARAALCQIVEAAHGAGQNLTLFGRVQDFVAEAEVSGTPDEMKDNLRRGFDLLCREMRREADRPKLSVILGGKSDA